MGHWKIYVLPSGGGTPSASAVADFNHDGIPDVAVADGLIVTGNSGSGYQYTNGGGAVVLGAGNGNFHPVVHYRPTEWPSSSALPI